MAMSAKNQQVGAAASDMGLGDQLKAQTEDEVLQRKKKLAKANSGNAVLGPAAMSLLGGYNG